MNSTTNYTKPYLIQRMTMVSRDCNIRFGKRFLNHYMGAVEFEHSEQAQRIRELHARNSVGCIMIDGCDIFVMYSPDRMTLEQVKKELSDLYWGKTRTKETTNFNREFRLRRKRSGLPASPHEDTNAWFDIENGVFWTWEKININEVRKNIAASVRYMDDVRKRAEEEARAVEERDNSSLSLSLSAKAFDRRR